MGDLGRTGLVAVRREILPLLGFLRAAEQAQWGETLLHAGQIAGQAVALAEVLPGPVNAALGAQALIAHHRVDRLINVGSAGAVDPELSPGDLVIADRALAHDAGAFLGRRFEPGGIMGRDGRGQIGHRRAFAADPGLIALALSAAQSFAGQVRLGLVVTGNQLICSTARRRWLHQTFDALAVEMETAAVAQVATAHRLPWLAIRGISDAAGDDLILDYERLRVYLDGERPLWRYWAGRWFYLLAHPRAFGRLRRLLGGLALASERASQVLVAMFQA